MAEKYKFAKLPISESQLIFYLYTQYKSPV